ncbi:hypothetical protein BH09PAT3_BH09PAT3_3500 [soil metagenome]
MTGELSGSQPEELQTGTSLKWRMAMLDRFVDYQATHDTAQTRDPLTKAYYGGLNYYLKNDPVTGPENGDQFRQELEAIWEPRMDAIRYPSDFGRRMYHTTKAMETKREYDDDGRKLYVPKVWTPNSGRFPEGLDKPELWYPYMDALVTDPDYAGQFWVYMGFPVMSNVSDRSKLVKFASLAYGLEEPSIIDWGCSSNDHIKRLSDQDNPWFKFKETRVMHQLVEANVPKYIHNKLGSSALNAMLDEPFTIGPSLGVDKYITQDRGNILWHWRISNGRSLSEYLNPDAEERSRQLARIGKKDSKVIETPMRADILDFDPGTLKHKYNVAVASVMLSQLSNEDVPTAINTMKQCLEDDGILVIFDWLDLNLDGTVRGRSGSSDPNLEIQNWDLWTASFYVYDNRRPDLGLQKIATVDDGRVNSLAFTPAILDAPAAEKYGLARLLAA